MSNEMVSNNNQYSYESILAVIGQVTEITKTTADSTAAIVADLQNTKSILGGIANQVKAMNDTVVNLDDRMQTIEFSEEITTEQNENISTAIKRRMFEILGNDAYDIQRYYRIFVMRLYKDSRKNAGMGSKVSRTRKRDYQRVLDYVEAWVPTGGCANLKAEADMKAIARVKAKQKGYDL